MLANLPFEIYFKEDPENHYYVNPHNEKLDIIITFYKEKYKDIIADNIEYYEYRAQQIAEEKIKQQQEDFLIRNRKLKKNIAIMRKKDPKQKKVKKTPKKEKIVEEVERIFDFKKIEKQHKIFEEKIMKDLKQLINIYEFLLEELAYDNQNNPLRIMGEPVTFQFLMNLMVPLGTAVLGMMPSFISSILSSPVTDT